MAEMRSVHFFFINIQRIAWGSETFDLAFVISDTDTVEIILSHFRTILE